MTLPLERTCSAETVAPQDFPSVVGAKLRVPLVTGEQIGYANLDHAASAPCIRPRRFAVP